MKGAGKRSVPAGGGDLRSMNRSWALSQLSCGNVKHLQKPSPQQKGGGENKGNAFSEYLEMPLFNGLFVCLVFLSLCTVLEVGSIPHLKVRVA